MLGLVARCQGLRGQIALALGGYVRDEPEFATLKIFLCYASEQHHLAEKLSLSLRQSGHDVFFDRTSLPPGEDYNPTIINNVRNSDLFVFLVSPESIAEGKYTRSELRFAREVWEEPKSHVIPVMAVSTPMDDIPNYLKAVSIFEPEGDLVAEVSAHINQRASGWTPEQTVGGQAKLVDENRRRLEELQWTQKLADIDQRWQEEKRTHMRRGQNGEEVVPSVRHGVTILIITIVMASVLAFVQANFFNDPIFRPFVFAPLVFLVFGVIGFLMIWRLAARFKRAKNKYLAKRDEVERLMEAAGAAQRDD